MEAQKALPRLGIVFAKIKRTRLGRVTRVIFGNVLGQRRVVGVRPIEVAEIKANLESLLAKRGAERTDQVPSRGSRLDHAQVILRRVPERHAVVMFRGEYGIARAGRMKEARPGFRIVFRRGKAVPLGHVIVVGNLAVKERP